MRKPFFYSYHHGEEQRVNMETATGEFVRVSEKLWDLTNRGCFDTVQANKETRIFRGFEADYLNQKARPGGYYA